MKPLFTLAVVLTLFGGMGISPAHAVLEGATSYSQSAYYWQNFYYSQQSYYSQSAYYWQNFYYSQSGYTAVYSQSAYYWQNFYYSQSGYGGGYSQSAYYWQNFYYSQSGYGGKSQPTNTPSGSGNTQPSSQPSNSWANAWDKLTGGETKPAAGNTNSWLNGLGQKVIDGVKGVLGADKDKPLFTELPDPAKTPVKPTTPTTPGTTPDTKPIVNDPVPATVKDKFYQTPIWTAQPVQIYTPLQQELLDWGAQNGIKRGVATDAGLVLALQQNKGNIEATKKAILDAKQNVGGDFGDTVRAEALLGKDNAALQTLGITQESLKKKMEDTDRLIKAATDSMYSSTGEQKPATVTGLPPGVTVVAVSKPETAPDLTSLYGDGLPTSSFTQPKLTSDLFTKKELSGVTLAVFDEKKVVTVPAKTVKTFDVYDTEKITVNPAVYSFVNNDTYENTTPSDNTFTKVKQDLKAILPNTPGAYQTVGSEVGQPGLPIMSPGELALIGKFDFSQGGRYNAEDEKKAIELALRGEIPLQVRERIEKGTATAEDMIELTGIMSVLINRSVAARTSIRDQATKECQFTAVSGCDKIKPTIDPNAVNAKLLDTVNKLTDGSHAKEFGLTNIEPDQLAYATHYYSPTAINDQTKGTRSTPAGWDINFNLPSYKSAGGHIFGNVNIPKSDSIEYALNGKTVPLDYETEEDTVVLTYFGKGQKIPALQAIDNSIQDEILTEEERIRRSYQEYTAGRVAARDALQASADVTRQQVQKTCGTACTATVVSKGTAAGVNEFQVIITTQGQDLNDTQKAAIAKAAELGVNVSDPQKKALVLTLLGDQTPEEFNKTLGDIAEKTKGVPNALDRLADDLIKGTNTVTTKACILVCFDVNVTEELRKGINEQLKKDGQRALSSEEMMVAIQKEAERIAQQQGGQQQIAFADLSPAEQEKYLGMSVGNLQAAQKKAQDDVYAAYEESRKSVNNGNQTGGTTPAEKPSILSTVTESGIDSVLSNLNPFVNSAENAVAQAKKEVDAAREKARGAAVDSEAMFAYSAALGKYNEAVSYLEQAKKAQQSKDLVAIETAAKMAQQKAAESRVIGDLVDSVDRWSESGFDMRQLPSGPVAPINGGLLLGNTNDFEVRYRVAANGETVKSFHYGQDWAPENFRNADDRVVVSPVEGKVVRIEDTGTSKWQENTLGEVVVIEVYENNQPTGKFVRLAHISADPNLKKDDMVSAGQQVALITGTGTKFGTLVQQTMDRLKVDEATAYDMVIKQNTDANGKWTGGSGVTYPHLHMEYTNDAVGKAQNIGAQTPSQLFGAEVEEGTVYKRGTPVNPNATGELKPVVTIDFDEYAASQLEKNPIVEKPSLVQSGLQIGYSVLSTVKNALFPKKDDTGTVVLTDAGTSKTDTQPVTKPQTTPDSTSGGNNDSGNNSGGSDNPTPPSQTPLSDLSITTAAPSKSGTNEFRFKGNLTRTLSRDQTYEELQKYFSLSVENKLSIDYSCDGSVDQQKTFTIPFRTFAWSENSSTVLLSEYLVVETAGSHCYFFEIDTKNVLNETNENNNKSDKRSFTN